MPARSTSASKRSAQQEDNALLQKQMDSNKINTPKNLLLMVGLVTGFLPAYLAHTVYYIELTHLFNLPLFLAVIGLTGYLLSHSYDQLTHAEFLKKLKPFNEVKSESDTKLLKDLRLQASMGYAMFVANVIFFVGTTVFQTYIFRNTNAYASFVISPLLTAACIWILAAKSMEVRKKKMGGSL